MSAAPQSVAPIPPRATLRLQFHAGFTFGDAAQHLDYFARLGISHLYASPIFTARAGSTHGYDVVDYSAVNPELGGEPGLRALVAGLRERGMGLVLDIVPNHMAVGGDDNPWWLDVLEWGRDSPYADFFDIDWEPPGASGPVRVLAPFLGKPRSQALEAAELTLRFDARRGRLLLRYYEHSFPICPRDYPLVLRQPGAEALLPLAARFESADRDTAVELRRELAELAASERGAEALAVALHAFSPAEPEAHRRLQQLLERQHYVLTYWREAARRINWRRFFEVTSLAALRADREEVFEATHALALRLYAEGLVDGLRVDHIDGLADPKAYALRLRRRLDGVRAQRPPGLRELAPYIVVEKILAEGEQLRRDWAVDGTTGYEFMDRAGGVLHATAGERPLTALWQEVSGIEADAYVQGREARREMLRQAFASEFARLLAMLEEFAAAEATPPPGESLRSALMEFLAHFPSYRSYVDAEGASAVDRAWFEQTLQAAEDALAQADRPAVATLRRWLEAGSQPGPDKTAVQNPIGRLQSLLPALAAKATEDTLFYRYGRLLSRCEVGSHPAVFAVTPAQFHQQMTQRVPHERGALLALATHDHKRGPDQRARLAVLSEIPDPWRDTVAQWRGGNAALVSALPSGPAPSPADELMFYETLVGAWEPPLRPGDAAARDGFRQRLQEWFEKAVREAKLRTSWTTPVADYEQACRAFVDALFDERHSGFLQAVFGFVQRVEAAGALNSLAQTVLQLTAPGVPDVYQGDDRWDFSLVDPDNRRPVDWSSRAAALDLSLDATELLSTWRDGRIKQWLIARALEHRRAHPAAFLGRYVPLQIRGPAEPHALAFLREDAGDFCIVAVSRLPLTANQGMALEAPLIPPEHWQDTQLRLPEVLGADRFVDVFSGAALSAPCGGLQLRQVFAVLPVALLTRAAQAGAGAQTS